LDPVQRFPYNLDIPGSGCEFANTCPRNQLIISKKKVLEVLEVIISQNEVLPLGHGEGLGLLGYRTDVMSFINDNNAPLEVNIDPLSDLLIDYVVVWHKYYVGSLDPLLLIVVWAHLPLLKLIPQLLYRQRFYSFPVYMLN
jgi:hypothetical protein